jgi:integrase
MPWKLIPPRKGKTPYYYVRGLYCGIRLDRSTGSSEAVAARTIFRTWKRAAERGEFVIEPKKGEPAPGPLTFARAATAYMRAGGDGQYLTPILKAWPHKLLEDVDQVAIDTLAAELYPDAAAATRNRQVHTPISAVRRHAGIEKRVIRPKGWKGNKSTSWLEPDQAFTLFQEADKIDPEFGLFCRFLTYTGMRLGEALGLELRQLRLERAFVYLGTSKNGNARGCHLPPILVEAFEAQPPRCARLKPIPKGQFGFRKGQGGRPPADIGVPFLHRNPTANLFRYHASGALRALLVRAMKNAGLKFPARQGGFHIFCHTYGSWMHRYGKLDRYGLTRTGRWDDADSADRYVHTEASEEAQRSDLLPTPKRGEVVEIAAERKNA